MENTAGWIFTFQIHSLAKAARAAVRLIFASSSSVK